MTNPCIQVEQIAKIKEGIALTNKDIGYMTKEILDIKKTQSDTNTKIDNNHMAVMKMFQMLDDKLEEKFVLRSEFKVGFAVLTAISVLVGIVVFFTSK